MIKKGRSNIYGITGKIFFALALLAFLFPGCKKKEAAPLRSAAQVKPLPKRAVQANSSAAKQPAPLTKGAAAPPAATAEAKSKTSPSVAAKASATAQSAGQLPVQKQNSSSRLAPAPKGISLDFSNRRDPFKPFVQAAPAQHQSATAGRSARPLKDALPIQRFDVEKFRISGIISGVKENSALLLDPEGKGYVVKAGMLIGNNSGRVKKITDTSLEVEENFRDDNGKVKKRLVKLMLIRKK